jgi:mono/diheme cytochrome c family protein
MTIKIAAMGLGLVIGLSAGAVQAGSDFAISDQMSRSGFVLENDLAIPAFDPVRGRALFASKGCVVCHSINGLGGEDAPEFSAEIMDHPMNAFGFAAKMWRGAGAMIMMQEDELGGQIELDGAELAAIIAFVHDEKEQLNFTRADIPEEILEIMEGGDHEEKIGEHNEAAETGEPSSD